jgi:uncharacterized protein (DUF1330 family)
MITLCIRYEIEPRQQAAFDRYARDLAEPIRRLGGELVGYWLPTKFAGPTNQAIALIDFPDLAAYERYRAALARDPAASAAAAAADEARCILVENRSFLQRAA